MVKNYLLEEDVLDAPTANNLRPLQYTHPVTSDPPPQLER